MMLCVTVWKKNDVLIQAKFMERFHSVLKGLKSHFIGPFLSPTQCHWGEWVFVGGAHSTDNCKHINRSVSIRRQCPTHRALDARVPCPIWWCTDRRCHYVLQILTILKLLLVGYRLAVLKSIIWTNISPAFKLSGPWRASRFHGLEFHLTELRSNWGMGNSVVDRSEDVSGHNDRNTHL